MASGSAVLIAMDALVRSNAVSTNYGALAGMKIQAGPPTGIVYMHAAFTPQVGTVLTAKLRVFQAGLASTGSRTLSLRRVTEPWREDKLTWANRPAVSATVTDAVTLAGVGVEGRVIEFDVSADAQKFIDGTWKNYGWSIESGNATNFIGIYSKDSAKFPPQLTLSWSATPAAPVDLTPSGGAVVSDAKPTLRWTFVDRAGDTTLSAVQVQIKGTNAGWSRSGGFTSPAFDTGPTPTGQPDSTVVVDFDLSDTAYGGLTAGNTAYWTARHSDGAGLWSSWSDPQSMTYQPHQSVTMTSPSLETVYDTTFPVAWTAASQSHYEVIVRSLAGATLYRRLTTSSSARQHLVPRGVLKPGGSYVVALRVWDTLGRQALPDAMDYVEVTRTVTYAESTDVASVTSLQVEHVDGRPSVALTWRRTTAPAMFAVWVDGTEHLVAEAASFGTGPGYAYELVGISGGRPHSFQVKAIVETTAGGVTSTTTSANNSATIADSIDPIGVWLTDPTDPDNVVLLLEESPGIVEVTMPEKVTVYEPLGSSTKVQVTSALMTREGTVGTGIIADYGSLVAEDMRDRLLAMKGARLKPVRLVWGRSHLDVWLRDVEIADDPIPTAVRYRVSFAFLAISAADDYTLS